MFMFHSDPRGMIKPIQTGKKCEGSEKLETLGCPTDSHRSELGGDDLSLPNSPFDIIS